jgi:glycosyltransferase involved in cell wall biosynthesis
VLQTALIIPAFNEGATLERVLASVEKAGLGCEVVVVNDGSKDRTAEVAVACGATVLSHPFNLGYGAALQTGYKYALKRGVDLVLQMDADGQHDPAQLTALLRPIVDGELDLVVGSRFLEASGYEMEFLRSIGRRLFTVIARLAGLRVSDPTSGFQAMNRRVLEVYSNDFFPTDFPDVDVLLAAYRHGLRVGERPVEMSKSERASTLHSGWRPIYYVYKMLLSSWSMSSARPRGPGSTTGSSRD